MPAYSKGFEKVNAALSVAELRDEDEAEVQGFLAARPLHTVTLSSMVRDNGLVNPLNRGTFYGCRNAEGHLEGVALIGHAMLFEARTAAALKAFARVAQSSFKTHMILAEQDRIKDFWASYAESGQTLRLACRELMFVTRGPVAVHEEARELRVATLADLELIVPVHAQMAYEESGVNPLAVDAEGFRKRCARRIEQGRVWVWVSEGRLIFKADVVAETSDCIYLEGIYINEEERGRGYGAQCLSQLSKILLTRAASICLLVNDKNERARRLYLGTGYKQHSVYETLFLR